VESDGTELAVLLPSNLHGAAPDALDSAMMSVSHKPCRLHLNTDR
jgi:hypothetical protein